MTIDLDKIDWQFQGTIVLPALALVATVVIYYLQKQRKHLNYGVTDCKQHSIDTIDDKKVVTTEIRVRYQNPANTPLTKEDFVSGITTRFIGATITHAEIFQTLVYNSVEASVSFLGDTATITTNLLNEGDFINVKYLVRNFDKKIHVDGRIVGVSHIGNFKIWDLVKQRIYLLFILYFSLLSIAYKQTHTFNIESVFKYLLISSIAVIVFSLIQIWREIKKQFVLYHTWDM